MNQCLGPCVNEVNEEEYKKITKQITQFIQGDTKEIIDDLQNKMMQASESLNFELAKEYRDFIQHINHVTSKQHVQFADQIDRDIFGYYQDKGYLSLQLFFMRNGKLLARDLNLVPLQDVHEQITQDVYKRQVQYYNILEFLQPSFLVLEVVNQNRHQK